MLEKELQTRILRFLSTQPRTFAIKIITANRRGVPDIVACVNGHYVGIEVKRPGNKVTPLQHYTLRSVELAGGTPYVASDLRDFIADFTMLQELLK